MGSRGDSGGGSGGNTGADAGFFVSEQAKKNKKPADYNPEKDDTAAKLNLFYNDPYSKKQGGPLVLKPFEPLFDAGAKKTREFFTDKVLTSERGMKNLGYTKDEFSALSRTKQEEVYKGYMSNRQSGATDAYGNLHTDYRRGSDGSIIKRGNNQKDEFNTPILTRAKNTYVEGVGTSAASPTGAEIDQATATTMSADETLLATNKKGRSQNILTSATGLGGTNLNIKKKTLG